jgi:diguanylate cyclase (GGDEF)-like protein
VNDTYGHLEGDNILRQVTDIMERNIFRRDVLCRYGGDEFALIFTKTPSEGILQAMEKIRKEIDEKVFIIGNNQTNEHITISGGLANFDEVLNRENAEIVKLADDRLYKAKSLGRNRIVYKDDE